SASSGCASTLRITGGIRLTYRLDSLSPAGWRRRLRLQRPCQRFYAEPVAGVHGVPCLGTDNVMAADRLPVERACYFRLGGQMLRTEQRRQGEPTRRTRGGGLAK